MNVMKIGLPFNCSLTYLGIKLVDSVATATYLQMLENVKMSMRRWSSKPKMQWPTSHCGDRNQTPYLIISLV
jgi:hypothetical protein